MTTAQEAPAGAVSVGIVGRYFNRQGGVSNVMAQLASRANRDYAVRLYSSEFKDWDPLDGDAVHIPMVARPAWLQVPTFAWAASRAVPRDHVQLLHAHDPQFVGADLYTAHSCFKHYIRSMRAQAEPMRRLASMVYPKHVSALAMARLAYMRSRSTIVAVSGAIRTELISEYGFDDNRVRVIYNGVDTRRFSEPDPRASREALGREIGRNLGDSMVFVFVGYEFERKRLGVAIRSFVEARNRTGRAAHLLVVGGADRTEYEALARQLGAAGCVSFLGHRSDIPSLLRASDVFLFPTRYEAASLAILEAAAAGLAIVTTDTAMAGEVLKDSESALLIPNAEDSIGATRAVESLMRSDSLRSRLGWSALQIGSSFDWDMIWAQYSALYDELLRSKRRVSGDSLTVRTAG